MPTIRTQKLRRDFNDLIRDENGRVSKTQIGTLIGQWLVIKLVLEHGSEIIANWDSLLVLFTALIAPEFIKKFIELKRTV